MCVYIIIYILKRNPSEVPWNACWCRWAMVDMGRANCAVQKGKRDEYDEPIIDLMYWWNAYWCLILWKQFGAQLVHGTLWNGAEAVFMNNFPQYSMQIDARMEAPCSDLRCNLKSLYKVSCVRMPICHAWLFRGLNRITKKTVLVPLLVDWFSHHGLAGFRQDLCVSYLVVGFWMEKISLTCETYGRCN